VGAPVFSTADVLIPAGHELEAEVAGLHRQSGIEDTDPPGGAYTFEDLLGATPQTPESACGPAARPRRMRRPVVEPVARALLDACRQRIRLRNLEARDPSATTLSRERRSVVRSPEDALVRVPVRPPLAEGDGSKPIALALTSCRYPGLTVFERDCSDETLAALGSRVRQRQGHQDACAAVWMLGDQVYVDATAGLLDATAPIERQVTVYRQAFNAPGFRSVAQHVPLYMLADDHEIGDLWTSDHLALGGRERLNYDMARATEWAYQTSHGPRGPRTGLGASVDAAFEIEGLPFYRLGTRWQRSRLQRRLLDPAQWHELQAWLRVQARRPGFKFIATGSVIAPGIRGGAGRDADNWQLSPPDRARLLELIDTLGVSGVVFISGDYHCAAVARIELPRGGRAWSLVAPPLYAPLRFANLPPDLLMPVEQIPLNSGQACTVELVLAPPAQSAPAGWMECEVRGNALRVRLMDGSGEPRVAASWAAAGALPDPQGWCSLC